jgi:enoyl-CoA hydratase/carnithine racemase
VDGDDSLHALGLTTVGLDVDDGVATVTLDRPEVLNAFDPTMVEELAAVWQALRADPAVRAIVLTASGDKAFCTGIDRSSVPEFHFDALQYEDPGKLSGP